jgi:hypothetical protein
VLPQAILDKKGLICLLVLLAAAIIVVLLSGCIDAPGDGVKVITVGATDFYSRVASFSGSGPLRDGRIKPDVVAPGKNVISCAPMGYSGLEYVNSFYAKESGTSLSTPVVAGVAALLLQENPDATPAGIKAALVGGARKLNNSLGESYEPFYQGAGLVDAGRSFDIMGPDICAVIPDEWIVGRWAFAEDSSYPGVDVGADRDQKKIYAMAPGDDEWTTKFLFASNRQRENIGFQVSGDVAGWITVMSLPPVIHANEQVIFGASIAVPNDTLSGVYNGSIDILEGELKIASVSLSVEVPKRLDVHLGSHVVSGIMKKNQWDYYYLETPSETRNLTALLSWPGSSNLDVILLDPSGKSYSDDKSRRSEVVTLIDPISGRYIIAVHARSITSLENYTLKLEESVIDVKPSSLNFGPLLPGESETRTLKLSNGGLPLDDLTLAARMENKVTASYHGEVARDERWEKIVSVDSNVSRMSLNLIWKGKEIDLDLDVYEPSGDSAGWSYAGKGNSEVLEVNNPSPGKWKFSVFGDKVPRESVQPFDLYVTSYSEDPKPSVKIEGPSHVASGTVGSISVTAKAPSSSEGLEKRGYIELISNNYSIKVPLVYTVVGASIKGIAGTRFNDSDGDGKIDMLTVGVNVAAGVPGIYEVRGAVNDCEGRMIRWVSNSSRIDRSGVIDLDVDGPDIWLKAGCGPLSIGDLLLYNAQGDMVGRFNASESIEKQPLDFQAPAAYFNGTFQNLSETRRGAITMVAVGVGVHAVKSGRYLISASLQSESGYEVGLFDRTVDLVEGNQTVVVEFNARNFDRLDDGTRLFLRDLTITEEDETIDEITEAWSSGEMNFGG